MSGLEVVGIVAAVVSAFHGGAELIKMHKKHRARKRAKREQHAQELAQHPSDPQDRWLQDMLHTSLEQGETAVIKRFQDEYRSLGRHSQLLCLGDQRAKQELLMIAVSLQAEVIASLRRAQHDLDVIIEMVQLQALYETAITKKVEAVRSICELRQRIEVSLPIPRRSADSALGISRRTSSESLAKTFVTAAVKFDMPEPMLRGLRSMRHLQVQSQETQRSQAPRRSDLSDNTLLPYEYLIPPIRPQDIEILTLAGEPIEHDRSTKTDPTSFIDCQATLPFQLPTIHYSSSSTITPNSDITSPRLEAAGLYSPLTLEFPIRPSTSHPPWLSREQPPNLPALRSYSTPSTSPWSPPTHFSPTNTLSPAISEPDSPSSFRPHASTRPYCSGALTARLSFQSSFSLQDLPTLPGSNRTHPSWRCSACDFNATETDSNDRLTRIEFAHGVRFRFPFLARSHEPYSHPPDALPFRPRYRYGCAFCSAEGRASAVHDGAGALMAHVAAKHRTHLTPEVQAKTRCVVGRVAGREETEWDVNIEDVTGVKSGAELAKWALHAVTFLPT